MIEFTIRARRPQEITRLIRQFEGNCQLGVLSSITNRSNQTSDIAQ